MKKLIILTGISGTGKTTMAKYIQEKLENVTIITVDTILENLCDIVGFKDKEQKKKIRSLTKKTSKKLLELCMEREDEIIVIDYPFSKIWEKYFKRISEKYQYDVLTVKMYGESFEDIWDRVYQRDMSDERHIIHEIDCYNVKDKDKIVNKKTAQNKNVLRRIYKEERRTKIVVGDEIKIISNNEHNRQKEFNKIKDWILEK